MALDQQSGNQNDKSPPLPPPSTLRASWRLTIFVFSLFLACIALPWWWFHSGSASSEERLRIEVSRQVPGYAFTNAPVSESEKQALATTNLISGVFVPEIGILGGQTAGEGNKFGQKYFRIFVAEWQAKPGQDLSVIHHTPDICWAGAGWSSSSLGQPTQVSLELPLMKNDSGHSSKIELLFECRIFKSPSSSTHELVMWCTLVGGQLLPEIHLFPVSTDNTDTRSHPQQRMGPYARRLVASHLWQQVMHRTPAQSTKQFIRLSLPLTESWESAIKELRTFAGQWLQVK